MIVAVLVHELGHVVMILLLKESIRKIRIGLRGAVIETAQMEGWKECLCALAGPIGSFSLLLFVKCFPRAACCGLIQGCYNLLPMYPLDGGRIVLCVLKAMYPVQKAEAISRSILYMTVILILCIGLWSCFVLKMGVLPVAVSLGILSGTVERKISCKECQVGVQ